LPLEPEPHAMPPSIPEIGPYARSRSNSVASSGTSWGPPPLTMSPPPAPPTISSPIGGDDIPSEELLPPPVIPPPPVPQRGILRRGSSSSSYNGKRVTIQTDHNCHCSEHFGTTSASSFESIMSPVSMSPIKTEEVRMQPIDLSAEFQHRSTQNHVTEFKSINPGDV